MSISEPDVAQRRGSEQRKRLAANGELSLGVPSDRTAVQISAEVIIKLYLLHENVVVFRHRLYNICIFIHNMYTHAYYIHIVSTMYPGPNCFALFSSPHFPGTFPTKVTMVTKACARGNCCPGTRAHRRPGRRPRVCWSGGPIGRGSTRHWSSRCPTVKP